MSEGAGLLVLEELNHALLRNARIYAEIGGYGMTSDAYHIVSPHPDGIEAARCMQIALDDAGVHPEDVDYINAHGTSTVYNDRSETLAIKKVFGEHAYNLAISSNKSMIGHLMGASGGVEAVFTILTICNGTVPPTINYENPDPDCDLNYVPNVAEKREVNVRQADPSDLRAFTKDIDRFQQLLAETAGRDRFHTHESDYYRRMLQVLAPKDGHDLSVRLMLADFEGQTLAAAVLAQFGDTMTYLHGASSSQHREVMAPYLLHWQAMLWAKEVGLSRYDFWGVAPEDSAADHSWSGLTRFKLGFGGQRESNLGTWELPGSKFWYGAYKITKRFF